MRDDLLPLLGKEEIGAIVRDLASKIRRDYRDKRPVLVSVLKGAFVFTADLVRELEMDVDLDFIQPSSYVNGTAPSEEVELVRGLGREVRGRHVIIVEGIVDRGRTLKRVMEEIGSLGPASIKVCSLLVRDGLGHEARVEYTGRTLQEGFVVGYGMDLDGRYRNLGAIYTLKTGR